MMLFRWKGMSTVIYEINASIILLKLTNVYTYYITNMLARQGRSYPLERLLNVLPLDIVFDSSQFHTKIHKQYNYVHATILLIRPKEQMCVLNYTLRIYFSESDSSDECVLIIRSFENIPYDCASSATIVVVHPKELNSVKFSPR